MRRVFKSILTLVLVAALAAAGVLFGPQLYRLLFGGANATWISERFSEELLTKRELVVLEKTITGQETVSTDAWLIGTVQEVVIPYSFSVGFSVDMSRAVVRYDEEKNVIQVLLPAPVVAYYKLIVDESNVETYDFLYPLSAERYAEMRQEIEQKLYDEVSFDPELEKSAWASAVSETEALYNAVLAANDASASLSVEVLELEPETAE